MRTLLITAISVAAATAVGCSSSGRPRAVAHSGSPRSVLPVRGTPSRPGSALDACGLLTDAQIVAATGATVVQHLPSPSPLADSTCLWTLKSSNPEDVVGPTLKVTASADRDLGAGVDRYQDHSRGYAAVAGIGERAAQGRNAGVGPVQLVVLQHGVVITVMAQITGNSGSDERFSESLARQAIAHV